MYRLVIAGIAVLLTVAGCAPMKPTATRAAPDVPPSSAAPPAPSEPPAPPESPPRPAPPSETDAPSNNRADHGSTPPSSSASAAAASSVKPKTPGDSRPVKQTGAAPAASRAAAAPAASAPTLNLADLEQRLRDTRAIGVFTKLTLKNQVDDLLGAFRDLYRGPNKRPPAELRQRYDQLLVKVLGLLQQGDPPLAQAIASSREAIWNILADPDQFAKI